jgi:hypothetical protein
MTKKKIHRERDQFDKAAPLWVNTKLWCRYFGVFSLILLVLGHRWLSSGNIYFFFWRVDLFFLLCCFLARQGLFLRCGPVQRPCVRH